MATAKDYLIPAQIARMTLKLEGLDAIPENLLITKFNGRTMESFILSSDFERLRLEREEAAARRATIALGEAAKRKENAPQGVRIVHAS